MADKDVLLHPLREKDTLELAVGQGLTVPEGVAEAVMECVMVADKLPPRSDSLASPDMVAQGVGLRVPPCVGKINRGLLLPVQVCSL